MAELYNDQPIHIDLFGKGYDPFGQSPLPFIGTSENKQAQIVGEAGVPAQFVTSGESGAAITVIDGYYQSTGFESGVFGWRLLPDGTLEANAGNFRGDITGANGTFSGTLQASAGIIGGFTITALSLYGGIIKTNVSAGLPGSDGVIMDQDGLRGYSSTLGEVFNLPTDGSAPEFSSGIIRETIYEISTNAILRTSETVGDGSADSAGILINETGFYACEANQDAVDANVKILVDGSGEFKLNVKGGQTDFFTGIGYFLGLSTGQYKFSIGDPAGNYMTWDGTYLRLKGSLDVGVGGLINNSSYTVANLPISPTSVGYNVASAYE